MLIQIVMYVLNYIDRNALPQARIQGIEKDIGLVGVEYNIVLSLTFIGYILVRGHHQATIPPSPLSHVVPYVYFSDAI